MSAWRLALIVRGLSVMLRGVEVVTAVDIRDDVEEVLLGRDIPRRLSLNVNWKEGTIDLRDP
ncbi:MAG: hypothetical protein ACE5Z5_11075 [Candidatus Bathyarchaeia archaeon]